MCIRHRETPEYLMEKVALDDLIVDALVEEDTRSRIRFFPMASWSCSKPCTCAAKTWHGPKTWFRCGSGLATDKVITTREADVDPIRNR